MPKRSRKNIRDLNVLAAHIVEQATGEPIPKNISEKSTKNPAAVALGRRGKRGERRLSRFVRMFGNELPQLRSLSARLASPNWRIFYSLLNRSRPRYNHPMVGTSSEIASS